MRYSQERLYAMNSFAYRIKRIAALTLALLTLAALTACGEKPDPADPSASVIDVADDPSSPVTAAPTAVPTPTPEPTPVPTDTPEPTATPKPSQAANPSYQGRTIYLTFDDGPYKYTDQVLDILDRYNIKATFFTVGNFVKAYPEQAKHIVERGHVLGCHSQTHEMANLYHGTDGFKKELNQWRETVKSVFGYDAGAHVMRFPGGTTNSTIGGRKNRGPYVEAANSLGYKAFDWNVCLNDRWLAGNKDGLPLNEYFWKSYLDSLSMYKNIEPLVFLIHDTEPESVKILPRVIEDLIAKGFKFGVCTDLDDNYLM